MLKSIITLGITLNKIEQQEIIGGHTDAFCCRLSSTGNCCHPSWTACGFPGAENCVSGSCLL
ncbi:hypothetical protein [uncultured Dokdonia sp.]|uniref:hypothetical protein n=1 Tax=uncultured Dokdonia sp. TaxID=575653 RepID=UPI00260DC323|nr:hypothetical protein [uncultured Dokdonia sp.]